MAGSGVLERRRERVRELLRADASRSNRSIAAEVRCSHMTVGRLRAEMAGQVASSGEPASAAGGQHPGSENLQPAGAGNERAVTHGGYSELRRRPLEDEHRARLAAEFPNALASPGGNDLVNLAARRLAIADLMAAWVLGEQGPIFARGREVQVSAPTRELRVLMDGHERAVLALAELEVKASGAGASPRAALDAHLAEIVAADDDNGGDVDDEH
jgi:hypothetical protein